MTVVDAVHGAPPVVVPESAPVAPGRAPARAELDQLMATAELRRIPMVAVREPGRDGRGVLEADLLVSPSHLLTLEQHLIARGFRRRPGWGRRPHRFWIRPVLPAVGTADRDAGSVDWLKLDVVTDLCFGPAHQIATGLGDAVLARRTAARLAPADDLGALLLHCLLDKGSLRASQRARLVELAAFRPAPGPLAPLCTVPGTPASTWDELLDLLERGDWATIEALGPAMKRHIESGRRLRVIGTQVRNIAGRRSSKLLTAAAARGPVVALVGPDGTGKSTLAERLTANPCIPTAVVYGGTYRSGEASSSVPGVDTAKVLRRLLRSRLDIAGHRTRGRLVVLDRHPVQARPGRSDAMPLRTRVRRRALAATIPEPDLFLVLDAPAVELHRRRPEHTVEQLERDRARHAALLRSGGAARLDATGTADEVGAEAMGLIWDRALGHGRR